MPDWYRHRHVVTFAETNVVGNVYFAQYAMWQGEARERFLFDHAPGLLPLMASGDLVLVTLQLQLSYIDQLFAGDVVDIDLALKERPGTQAPTRIDLAYTYRRAEVTVAVGSQTLAAMQRVGDGYTPCALPTELLRAFQRHAS